MSNMTRLGLLQTLAEQTLEIYSEDTQKALDSGIVPRYACLISEGSGESTYADNPDLTVHKTLDEVAAHIAYSLDDGWAPQTVLDLETGNEVGYAIRVEMEAA